MFYIITVVFVMNQKLQHKVQPKILNFFRALKSLTFWGTWLARSVECVTLDLGVVSSGPTLGAGITEDL